MFRQLLRHIKYRYYLVRVRKAFNPTSSFGTLLLPDRYDIDRNLLERYDAAGKAYRDGVVRTWQICGENGGVMQYNASRINALIFAAELGAIRHVDDELGTIVYTPKT